MNGAFIVLPGPAFTAQTKNVDVEIANLAGPQLVVPVDNARYALNAVYIFPSSFHAVGWETVPKVDTWASRCTPFPAAGWGRNERANWDQICS